MTQKNRQFLPFLLEKKLKRSYEICLFSPRLSKFILAPKQEVNLPQASEITFVSKTRKILCEAMAPSAGEGKYLIKKIIPLMFLQHSETPKHFYN